MLIQGLTYRPKKRKRKNRWGGEKEENWLFSDPDKIPEDLKEGKLVKELQEDLVKLGYWVSQPNEEYGMKCDGGFGIKTKGAVITFQKEHSMDETGIVDKNLAYKIKQALQESNWKRPVNNFQKKLSV